MESSTIQQILLPFENRTWRIHNQITEMTVTHIYKHTIIIVHEMCIIVLYNSELENSMIRSKGEAMKCIV